MVHPQSLTPTLITKPQLQQKTDSKPKTLYPPFETCGKTNHSTERCLFGANTAHKPPLCNRKPARQSQVQQNDTQNNTNECVQAPAQLLN